MDARLEFHAQGAPAASGGFSGSDHAQSVAGLLPQKALRKRGGGVMPYIYEELHDCAGGEEPLTQMERKELAASINRFLEGLDRESRIIFMRRYWYMDGIGADCQGGLRSASKVKSSLYRSRETAGDI